MPRKTAGGSRAGTPLALTKETYKAFRDRGAGGSVVVVLHHMDGCPYCSMIRPAWTDAVRRAGPGAPIAEMLYDPMWTPAEMADVRGFPTIRAYRDGRAIAEYQGDRTANSIFGFIGAMTTATKPTKPVAKPAASAKKKVSASAKKAKA